MIITKNKKIFCMLFAFVFLLELISPCFSISASAEEVIYSDVLEDLQRSDNFDSSKYPEDSTSLSIEVIQIAESKNRKLYVYTYQPGNVTKHREALFLKMALQSVDEKNVEYKNYSLTWVSGNGVFDKYLVDYYAVPLTSVRNYTIDSIYRAYDSEVDDESSIVETNSINCISYSVAQTWCSYYSNGVLMYEKYLLKSYGTSNPKLLNISNKNPIDTEYEQIYYYFYVFDLPGFVPRNCIFNISYNVHFIVDEGTYDIEGKMVSNIVLSQEKYTTDLRKNENPTFSTDILSEKEFKWSRLFSSVNLVSKLSAAIDSGLELVSNINNDSLLKYGYVLYVGEGYLDTEEFVSGKTEKEKMMITDQYGSVNASLKISYIKPDASYDIGLINDLPKNDSEPPNDDSGSDEGLIPDDDLVQDETKDKANITNSKKSIDTIVMLSGCAFAIVVVGICVFPKKKKRNK